MENLEMKYAPYFDEEVKLLWQDQILGFVEFYEEGYEDFVEDDTLLKTIVSSRINKINTKIYMSDKMSQSITEVYIYDDLLSDVLSIEEDQKYRESWMIGSKCLIYSEVNNEWICGEIMDIFTDNEGEWLNVKYIINKEIFAKPIQRLNKDIKPIFNDTKIKQKRYQIINSDRDIVTDSLFDVLSEKQINKVIQRINQKMNAQQNNEQRQEIAKDESKEEDILAIINRRKGTLFDAKTSVNFNANARSIERIKFILEMYNIWLLNAENNNKNNMRVSFDEIIRNYLHSNYSYIEFMIDYKRVTDIKKDLFENNQKICNAKLCKIINRNTRNRAYFANNNRELLDLYYIKHKNKETDSFVHNMSTQQMIDSLHTYVYHTLYIKDLSDKIEKKESDEFNHLCDDAYVTKLCEIISA
eukprot:149956_1